MGLLTYLLCGVVCALSARWGGGRGFIGGTGVSGLPLCILLWPLVVGKAVIEILEEGW